MFKRFIEVVAISSIIVLAACNTVRGAGEDVESAANAVDKET